MPLTSAVATMSPRQLTSVVTQQASSGSTSEPSTASGKVLAHKNVPAGNEATPDKSM